MFTFTAMRLPFMRKLATVFAFAFFQAIVSCPASAEGPPVNRIEQVETVKNDYPMGVENSSAGGASIDREGDGLSRELPHVSKVADISRLSLEDAIRIIKGNGVRRLIMFDDIDCPFCREAMEWLKTQDNYTLYVFLFPLPIHPKSHEKSLRVLCGKDPAAALEQAESGREVDSNACSAGERMLARHRGIASEFGVEATPLFITDTGTRILGFQRKELEKYLHN